MHYVMIQWYSRTKMSMRPCIAAAGRCLKLFGCDAVAPRSRQSRPSRHTFGSLRTSFKMLASQQYPLHYTP